MTHRFVVKLLLPVITLALTACAGAAPTPTPEATREPAPTSTPAPSVTYKGTSFSYDNVLASGVTAETIPAVEPSDGPEWDVAPEHVQFSFNGYALPDTFHEPRIYVYPVAEFEAANSSAAGIISDLRQLLEEKSADRRRFPSCPCSTQPS